MSYGKRQAIRGEPFERRTKAQVAWEVVKELYPQNIATIPELRQKFNVSDLLMRQATGWLRANRLVVHNGAHIALTATGLDFHNKRMELLND